MAIFEIHSFTHSFTCAVRGSVATQCTGQAASGVNYCYLVAWGSITGTHTVFPPPRRWADSQRFVPSRVYLSSLLVAKKKKKRVYASLIKMSVTRRTLLWTGGVSRAQISCFYCCYLYLRQMRPKSWQMDPFIHHSSSWIKLTNEGTSFRWRTFRVFVAPEDFWHFFRNSHIFYVLSLFM